MTAHTTIRVQLDTRDRINEEARLQGQSADSYIRRLIEEDAWRKRMAQVKTAMRSADESWRAETEEWEAVAAVDLEKGE